MSRGQRPPIIRQPHQLGKSQRDLDAYAVYAAWCSSIGARPASETQYLKTTAHINPQVIAWTGVK